MAAAEKRPQTKSFNPQNTQFFSIAMLELAREAPPWVKEARDHLKEKRYPEAERACREGLAKTPRQLEGILYLAEATWEQQRASEAVNALKEAIQVAPKDSRPYALLGRYLLLKGLREQAVKFLEQAITLNPDDAASRKQLERTRNLIKRGYKKVDAQAAAPEARKEATRMVAAPVGPDGVPTGEVQLVGSPGATTGELETVPARAAGPVAAGDVDAAVAALLTGNLFQVDGSQQAAGSGKAGTVLRAVLGLVVVAIFLAAGAPAGLFLRKRITEARGGTPLERALGLLGEDTPAAVNEAAAVLDRLGQSSPEFDAAQPLLALAHALRMADLGGGVEARESAERALNSVGEPDAPGLRTPAALLARHLVSIHARKPDDKLQDELEAALKARPTDAWAHVAHARFAEDAQDDETALVSWRAAWRADPSLPRTTLGLARAHARIGDRTEALRLVDGVLGMRPAHSSALILAVLCTAGDAKALATYEARARATLDDKATPPDEAARLAAALALARAVADDAEGAAVLWERASTISTAMPAAAWQIARARLALGEPEKARAILGRITEKNSTDVPYHRDYVRAATLVAAGPDRLREIRAAKDKARDAGTKGKEKDADTGWPILRGPLGNVHLQPGMVTLWDVSLDHSLFPEAVLAAAVEGLRDMSTRVQVDRVRAAGLGAEASAAARAGNAKAARTLLKGGLETYKNEPDLLLALARIEAASGDWKEAERVARDVLDQNPQDPRARTLVARALLENKDAAAALRELESLEDSGFESGRIKALKARALLEKGRSGEAARELQKAQQLDPGDPEVVLASARVALSEQRDEDALKVLAPAARANPEAFLEMARSEPTAGPAMATAAAEAGLKDAAADVLRALARERPKDPSVQYHLGMVQQLRREKEGAVAALKAFLEYSDAADPRREPATSALKSMGVDAPGGESAAPGGGGKKKGRKR